MDTTGEGIDITDRTPRFRWTPFDTAGGTIVMGVVLTCVIVALLRVLH